MLIIAPRTVEERSCINVLQGGATGDLRVSSPQETFYLLAIEARLYRSTC